MSKSPFLESIREQIRIRHYSIRTEKTYLYWISYLRNLWLTSDNFWLTGVADIKAFLYSNVWTLQKETTQIAVTPASPAGRG